MENTPPHTYRLSEIPVFIGSSFEKEILANSSSIMNRDVGTIRYKTRNRRKFEIFFGIVSTPFSQKIINIH